MIEGRGGASLRRMKYVLAILCITTLFACGDDDEPGGDAGRDSASDARDGNRPDGDRPDGDRPDGGPDGSPPDARMDGRDDADPMTDATVDTSTDATPDGATDPGAMITWPQRALDPAAVVRASILFGSCIPDDGIADALNDYYYEPESGLRLEDSLLIDGLDCLGMATDGCAAIERCTAVHFDLEGPCDDRCDGNTYHSCDDEWHFSIDCMQYFRTCDVDARGCRLSSEEVCSDTFTASCVDGRPSYCDETEQMGMDCAMYGLECAIADGDAACRGTGSECGFGLGSPSSLFVQGTRCTDATHLEACINGGSGIIDCAQVATGFTCQTAFGKPFCGLDDACDPTETTDSCDGTTLVTCNAGRVDRVDCTALGFTECHEGDAGRVQAYCAPSLWLP